MPGHRKHLKANDRDLLRVITIYWTTAGLSADTAVSWLAWLPGGVADLSHSSVLGSAEEGFAGRSGP